jgi:hypothetical protein
MRDLLENVLVSTNAFDEHGARQDRDAPSGYDQRSSYEIFGQTEGWVGDDPVDGVA